MGNRMITCTQILQLLETLQEFVNTNPNEVTALAENPLLIEAIYADLSQQNAASVN